MNVHKTINRDLAFLSKTRTDSGIMFYVVEIVFLSMKLCSSDLNIQRSKSFIKILTKIDPIMGLLELRVVRFEKSCDYKVY